MAHICMMSLALPIETDPRTSRQAEALATEHRVTVIGYGTPKAAWRDRGITFQPVDRQASMPRRAYDIGLLALGRLSRRFYDRYLTTRPRYVHALALARAADADVYHASDWAMIPIAVRAAAARGVPVVFDADEYWPLEHETNRLMHTFFSPLIDDTLRRWAPAVTRTIHVSQPMADRYAQTYGLAGEIVYNAPDYVEVADHAVDPDRVRLIYNGAAMRHRRLDGIIRGVALAQARFTLTMLLVGDPDYVDELRALADAIAPGRVTFPPPVPFEAVVTTIADHDLGVFFTAPDMYTNLMTLPNKVFEAAVAGLGVVTAPSPALAALVTEYGYGVVADGFAPEDLAAALNALTHDRILDLRARARAAGRVLHYGVEAGKLRAIYAGLLGSAP